MNGCNGCNTSVQRLSHNPPSLSLRHLGTAGVQCCCFPLLQKLWFPSESALSDLGISFDRGYDFQRIFFVFCTHKFHDHNILIYNCLVLLAVNWLMMDVLLWAIHFGYIVYRNVGNLETQVPLSWMLKTFKYLESPVPFKILTIMPSPVQKSHLQRCAWQGVASCRSSTLPINLK